MASGIFAAGNSSVTNAGAITIGDAAGPVAAIVAINDDNTVSNLAGATITVGLNADGILVQGNRAIVNNAGTIKWALPVPQSTCSATMRWSRATGCSTLPTTRPVSPRRATAP